MAFRNANMAMHAIKFNSATSSDFLDLYNNLLNEELIADNAKPKHKTFAPSQMRCDRLSWFRLRGVQPDKVKNPDATLAYTAQTGTACHEAIQKRLSEHLQNDWISVQNWVDANPELFTDYDIEITTKGYESMIDMKHPYPIRFACDGLVKFQDKVRLLEIKTSEFSSWNELIEPKSAHMSQITCYSTLLHIPDVLFLYQDRQYGGLKCFEVQITETDWMQTRQKMDHVLECVETNIAPDGLPTNDSWCSPSMCPYHAKCKEWGR